MKFYLYGPHWGAWEFGFSVLGDGFRITLGPWCFVWEKALPEVDSHENPPPL